MRAMRNEIFIGDALDVLKRLPSDSIHCCVSSPPYWNLRNYQAEGQIGLEETPAAYVQKLVDVFREVRRVLHPTGTLWLNLGDSYANDGKWGGSTGGKHATALHGETSIGREKRHTGLKPKDLVGIPWAVAFALREDGWYLRSDNVWAKGNPMPEPVTDRTTRSHEFVFMLSKNERYFYDHRAIMEPFRKNEGRDASPKSRERNRGGRRDGFTKPNGINPSANGGANKRDVWMISASKFKGAHFATFPPELPEICIKAGTSQLGCCPECFEPYKPRYEKQITERHIEQEPLPDMEGGFIEQPDIVEKREIYTLTGWAPGCKHDGEPVPCLVLDPFAGSGTTLMVAKLLRRDYVGIELNPEYAKIIETRTRPALEEESAKVRFDYMMSLSDD